MNRPASIFARVAREPLVHFLVLAVGIFAAHRALRSAPEATDEPREIWLEDAYLDALVARETQAGGEGDREEIARRWIREEALAREAQRLGLDERDPILRRRLVQKMELWLEAHVEVEEPDEGALEAEREAHAERYRQPTRIDLEHVFFARDQGAPVARAEVALTRLRAGEPVEGDPFLLGARLAGRTRADLAERFGPGFADRVLEATPDRWTGPVESAYGTHVVRVTRREDGRLPPLAEVRDAVRAEVLRRRRDVAVRRAEQAVIERYRVVRGGG